MKNQHYFDEFFCKENSEYVTPLIKSQGIKTKIIPYIKENFYLDDNSTWIEPFLGTGSVLLNVRPKNAIVNDTNIHIINLYKSIQNEIITPEYLEIYLDNERKNLEEYGSKHYYYIRDRFNNENCVYDFIFLSRCCFNGLMRFNKNGNFNAPFCKDINKLSKKRINFLINNLRKSQKIIKENNWKFLCQDWKNTLEYAKDNDLVYLDPPYSGRHTNYYNVWNDNETLKLHNYLYDFKNVKFMYSTWLKDNKRINDYVYNYFSNYNFIEIEHFYSVGSYVNYRNNITEVLILNY